MSDPTLYDEWIREPKRFRWGGPPTVSIPPNGERDYWIDVPLDEYEKWLDEQETSDE